MTENQNANRFFFFLFLFTVIFYEICGYFDTFFLGNIRQIDDFLFVNSMKNDLLTTTTQIEGKKVKALVQRESIPLCLFSLLFVLVFCFQCVCVFFFGCEVIFPFYISSNLSFALSFVFSLAKFIGLRHLLECDPGIILCV